MRRRRRVVEERREEEKRIVVSLRIKIDSESDTTMYVYILEVLWSAEA
jgi:hypothetical protein